MAVLFCLLGLPEELGTLPLPCPTPSSYLGSPQLRTFHLVLPLRSRCQQVLARPLTTVLEQRVGRTGAGGARPNSDCTASTCCLPQLAFILSVCTLEGFLEEVTFSLLVG